MPEGIPDELWTDYANFFWDNRTGLFFGAALFGLGFTTLILAGFVSLCRRGFGGTSGKMTVSKQPRRSIDNPLYITNRENTTSREVLVSAAAAIDDHQSTAQVTDIEEPMEEPTVIYENEQFFNAAKRSKTSDVKEAVVGASGDARNLQPKFAYSDVIKKSNDRARKKKEGGDDEKKGKRKKRDVYSQVIKKENTKRKKTQKAESEDSPEASESLKGEKAETSEPNPKHETEHVPEVPEKSFEDSETNRKKTDDENGKGVEEESRQKHNDGHGGQGDESHGGEGQGGEGQGSEDEGPDDYVNISAPRILSIGDEEAYLDMSQKEDEHDPEDYVNCTNLKTPV